MKRALIWLLERLSATGEIVPSYGSYHLAWIFATVAITAILILFFHSAPDKTVRIIISSVWALMLVMEILKQMNGSLHVVDGEIIFAYNWSIFPYQFCSTPLYVMPLAAFMKDGKKRDVAILFLSTYAVIGGLVVLIAPSSVLYDNVFINFQSMFHHSIQVFMGVFLSVRYRHLLKKEDFSGATVAFLFTAYLALLINLAFHDISGILRFSSPFNMFFINPYERYVPPILEGAGLENVPYLLFLLGYLFIFILTSAMLMKAEKFLTEKINYEKINIINFN